MENVGKINFIYCYLFLKGEVGTLVDSGAEESEDEWNYIKGKTTNNNHLEQSTNIELPATTIENLMDVSDLEIVQMNLIVIQGSWLLCFCRLLKKILMYTATSWVKI
jgi:hypothetical protein